MIQKHFKLKFVGELEDGKFERHKNLIDKLRKTLGLRSFS